MPAGPRAGMFVGVVGFLRGRGQPTCKEVLGAVQLPPAGYGAEPNCGKIFIVVFVRISRANFV